MKNILIITLLFLLFSCGARKSSKSKIETSKQSENITSDVLKSETVKDIETVKQALTEVNFSNEKLEPIDVLKPIIKTQNTKDGTTITTWQNAKVDRSIALKKEVVKEIKRDKSKILQQSESKALLKIKENKENIKKETQRESYWILWILLLIITSLYFYVKQKSHSN
jgi:DNA-directed RNA polymerase subunit H (RpoH/RPB5)